MKTYISRQTIQQILKVMEQFPEQEVFELNLDNSSGIGSTVTLTVDVLYNSCAGKFTVEVQGTDNW
jgi:hypothetical protein